MTPLKQTIKILKQNGYILARHGKKHDVYFNAKTNITIPVKRHDFDENDMRYILKEAGLN